MTTRKMKKLELHVLASDIDAVLEYLGKKAVFQIEYPDRDTLAERGSEGSECQSALRELEAARTYLGLEAQAMAEEGALPGEGERAAYRSLLDSLSALKEAEAAAKARLDSAREALQESRAFSKLKMPYAELELLTFIVMRIGRVETEKIPALRSGLSGSGVVIELDGTGRIAALASKKGRFALDSELKNSGFVPIELPKDFQGVPDGLIAALEAEEADAFRQLESAEAAKEAFASDRAEVFPRLMRSFSIACRIDRTKRRLDSSEHAYRICGWTAKDGLKGLADELTSLTAGRVAIRSFDPEEIPEVRSGKRQVPVSVANGRFVGSFEKLVFSYGTPLYGTIDPTPLVAFFFVLLFSIMFGDLGQGGVILLTGIYLRWSKKGPFLSWKKFAPIFMAIGIGSMIMGVLDGSTFSNEELLVPLTRTVTGALFGVPMDRVITLMPTEGVGKILAFFGFTIGIGILINSIGLVVNMVNLARLRRYGKLLFSKTGLAGSLFFWYVLAMGVRILLKGRLFGWDAIVPALCLLALFMGEALERLMEGHRPLFPDGFLAFIIQGLVEIIESVSYYASNTVSFLRVGAFALSHAVLSFIVFAMGDMIRGGVPVAGPVLQILVMVIGNAVIIVLEGMVVAIQVVRLQYYEFFSKFFSETGSRFEPFSFADDRV